MQIDFKKEHISNEYWYKEMYFESVVDFQKAVKFTGMETTLKNGNLGIYFDNEDENADSEFQENTLDFFQQNQSQILKKSIIGND